MKYYEIKNSIFNWLDNILMNDIPKDVHALCFNLYQNEDYYWSLELVGTNHYDEKDDDWACHEICDFGTRKNPFVLRHRAYWGIVLNLIYSVLLDYIESGKYAHLLKSKLCVAVGFVDGDLKTVYKKQNFRKKHIGLYSLWNIILVACLILVYLFDVFVFKNSDFKDNLLEVILTSMSINLVLYRLSKKEKNTLKQIEDMYTGEMQGAFYDDADLKYNFLKALYDYHNEKYFKSLKRLKNLYDKARNRIDRKIIVQFAALDSQGIGDTESALKLYDVVLEENPFDTTALNNLAVLSNREGKYRQAIKYAERMLDADPQDSYAYSAMATAYLKLFDVEKSRENAHKALQLDKNLSNPAVVLSIAYAAENQKSESQRYIDTAISGGKDKEDIIAAIENYKADYKKYCKEKSEFNTKVQEWYNLTQIPSIHFTLNGSGRKSIVGGSINETAPMSPRGMPMRLLAAIFCSELPENSLLPKRGVLRFYITPDEDYGMNIDPESLNIQQEFKVLFDENEDNYITYESVVEAEDFPVYSGYRISFSKSTDAMSSTDYRFENTYNDLFRKSKGIKFNESQEDDFLELIDRENHKMLGYPNFVQEDIRTYSADYKKYDVLLFQLTSEFGEFDDKVNWGDAGACRFFIPHDKLKNCDFSDILYAWDCC